MDIPARRLFFPACQAISHESLSTELIRNCKGSKAGLYLA
jgi:hypothetical protein